MKSADAARVDFEDRVGSRLAIDLTDDELVAFEAASALLGAVAMDWLAEHVNDFDQTADWIRDDLTETLVIDAPRILTALQVVPEVDAPG